MRLVLQRLPTNVAAVTHGELVTVDLPVQHWLTLEDAIRDVKIPHETAIPSGVYPLTLTLSVRFKVVLPLVNNVPGFDGIRIHAGNVINDTDGCILVGQKRGVKDIAESRLALQSLLHRLQTTPGPHVIEIRNPA